MVIVHALGQSVTIAQGLILQCNYCRRNWKIYYRIDRPTNVHYCNAAKQVISHRSALKICCLFIKMLGEFLLKLYGLFVIKTFLFFVFNSISCGIMIFFATKLQTSLLSSMISEKTICRKFLSIFCIKSDPNLSQTENFKLKIFGEIVTPYYNLAISKITGIW